MCDTKQPVQVLGRHLNPSEADAAAADAKAAEHEPGDTAHSRDTQCTH